MNEHCQIDFYVLEDESLSAELLACRLALMAWEQGNRIMVLTESREQTEQVDALMWEHPPGRFLPHAQRREKSSAPVLIGTLNELADESGEVVINLTNSALPRPERFHRLLEPVPADPVRRSASRDKFRAYRTHGLQPSSHAIKRQ